jgi:tetratricopeptide (TPR) repeat protein
MANHEFTEVDPRVIATYVGSAILLGLLVVFFNQARLVAALWSGACLGLGGTVGFLFGIPRTVQTDSSAPQRYAQKVNTNLEQISDWLTKILVGLGLTQLSQVPFKLQQSAGYIAEGIGNTPEQRVFAYALILYFSIVGFIAGYLLTRVFLPRILFQAESGLDEGVILEAVELEKRIATPPGSGGGTPPGLASDDKARAARASDIVKVTAEILDAYTDLDKKASAETLRQHITQLEPMKDQFPVFRMLYIILGRLYRWSGNYAKAIETLSEFIQQKEKEGSSKDKDAAAAFYNRACYYALMLPSETSVRDELKRKGLNDLKEAIDRVKEYALEAVRDTDFTALADDDDFKRLTAT